MSLVKRLRKLNKAQVKAIAELLIEIGKWLLLAVVFSSFFSQGQTTAPGTIIISALLAVSIIVFAVWILKEVKDE